MSQHPHAGDPNAHGHPHDDTPHHDHPGHDHAHGAAVSPMAVLVAKGYVDPAAVDAFIDTYETKVGPRNGAHVVAHAWSDPEFKAWLLADATAAIASLGYTGRQGEHMRALENTA